MARCLSHFYFFIFKSFLSLSLLLLPFPPSLSLPITHHAPPPLAPPSLTYPLLSMSLSCSLQSLKYFTLTRLSVLSSLTILSCSFLSLQSLSCFSSLAHFSLPYSFYLPPFPIAAPRCPELEKDWKRARKRAKTIFFSFQNNSSELHKCTIDIVVG